MLNELLENELLGIDRFASRIDQKCNLHEKTFFFQHEGKRLFGIIHVPLNGSNIQHKMGFVMCQPYLIEPLITQRLEADIARSLAQKGFPVFRFHYRGCGDSEGDFKDATLAAQISDTLRAVEVFTAQVPLDSVGLLGIRLGGTVALMAAEKEKRVKFLVLCEPIIEPRRYFLELLRTIKLSALANQQKTISTEKMIENLLQSGSVDILGYPLYKEIFEEAESVNLLQSTKNFSGKTLLIQIAAFSTKIRKTFQDICEQIQRNGGSCDIKVILERKLVWDFISHPPIRSEIIIQSILKWCGEQIDFPILKTVDNQYDKNKLSGSGAVKNTENSKIPMMEYPVFIQGRNYDLFGILHIPDISLLREKTVIILLNGTSIPRTHRNRTWVRLARQLAKIGFYTFRFDYRGLGESTGDAESGNLDRLHTQDVINIIDFLTTLICPKQIILAGTCFGARTALSVLSHRKFHGLVFISAPTVNENGRAIHTASKKNLVHYLKKLQDWKKWGFFLDVNKFKRNIMYVIQKRKNKLALLDVNSLIDDDVSNQFFSLMNSKIPSLIIYGTLDDYYENIRRFFQKIEKEKLQNIEFAIVRDEDVHSFVPAHVQDVVITKILNWIASKYHRTEHR